MENCIEVTRLSKHFQVAERKEGFIPAIRSLVKKGYKIVKAVDEISFQIKPGEMVAFLGPNGAGKTTTLKMLSGILQPSSGTVHILGFNPQKRQKEFQKRISLVMGQKNQLWWDLPPTDTFLLNKDIYQIPNKKYRTILEELTELLEIREILGIPVRKLSLGQRMKCELLASLLHQPEVIFLDEPTIGLDLVVQKKIRAFLKEYNKKNNATIILTSHYMDDVKEVCDRVILIDHGHKIYDDQIKHLIADYAKDKYLRIDFTEKVSRFSLDKIGKVIAYDTFSATIEVPRISHTQKASKLLSEFPVENLDITEIELEDIILKSFTKTV